MFCSCWKVHLVKKSNKTLLSVTNTEQLAECFRFFCLVELKMHSRCLLMIIDSLFLNAVMLRWHAKVEVNHMGANETL